MKKFKLFGFAFVLFLMLGFVNVGAKTLTFKQIVEQAEEDTGQTVTTTPDYKTNTIEGNVTIEASGMTLNATYSESTKEFVFIPAGSTTTSGEDTILTTILTAVSKLQGFSDEGGDIKADIAKYTYAKCGLEGTVGSNDRFTTFKANANKFNLNCTNKSSSNNSSNSSSSSTTGDVKNPKTGVFVPIAGLSILIVASVVCLVWISKKSFKL